MALCAPAAAALGSLVPLSVPRGLVSQMRREGLPGEKVSVKSMSWENMFQPLNPYRSGIGEHLIPKYFPSGAIVACGFVFGDVARRVETPNPPSDNPFALLREESRGDARVRHRARRPWHGNRT